MAITMLPLVRRARNLRGRVASKVARRLFPRPPAGLLGSCVCTEERLDTPDFRRWMDEMAEGYKLHRKVWEWCYVAQALHERGMLRPGSRGLGFAVGTEPLAALFAQHGCTVVATDLDPNLADADQRRWMASGQHATTFELLNGRGLCLPDQFRERVSLRYADMNDIPADLTGFDFLWSSCSFEHLGSIEHGARFLENMVECLRPGGVAVHTTEFNVMSNRGTIEVGPDVLFRRRDIEEMARRVEALGCRVAERDYFAGDRAADWWVDTPPYGWPKPHLKLEHQGYVITSFGLIVEKPA